MVEDLEWDMDRGSIKCTIFSMKQQELKLLIRENDTTWESDSETNSTKKGEPISCFFKANERKTFYIKFNK